MNVELEQVEVLEVSDDVLELAAGGGSMNTQTGLPWCYPGT